MLVVPRSHEQIRHPPVDNLGIDGIRDPDPAVLYKVLRFLGREVLVVLVENAVDGWSVRHRD